MKNGGWIDLEIELRKFPQLKPGDSAQILPDR
jgi:hypothetical protein